MKLYEIAERLNLQVEGNPNCDITGVAGLDDATSTQITFLSNPRYAPKLRTTHAAAVIVNEDFGATFGKTVLRSFDAYLAFAQVVNLFYVPPSQSIGIHPTAVIASSVQLGERISIGANVVIEENVVIGNDVTIRPNCTIYTGAKIGDQVYIHSNCVVREFVEIGSRCCLQNNSTVGSDGFGYAKQPDGTWLKIVQSGRVVVEEDVEIGAGAQIDRATVGETRIKRGTKIDNLVQIGHGSVVGEDTLLCAQVGLAGSSRIGNRVVLAGQVGVAGHLSIGDGVVATAQTGIPNSIEAGQIVSGYPAIENSKWLKATVIFKKLPELQKAINSLNVRLNALEKQSKD